jgi:hypothetical protein
VKIKYGFASAWRDELKIRGSRGAEFGVEEEKKKERNKKLRSHPDEWNSLPGTAASPEAGHTDNLFWI